MKREKRVTVKDVAKHANTSVATVSRVLSNVNYPISDELRQRVEDAAKALSFTSTSSSKQNKNSIRQDIGLIVPTISNPFYMLTIQGISAACDDNGYHLILCNSQRSIQNENRMLQELCARKVGGVIISSMNENSGALAEFVKRGMFFVQLDQQFENNGCFNINYDAGLGALLAIRHLQDNGHSRIAFVSTPLTRWTRKMIYDSYCEQMGKAGFEIENCPIFIKDADISIEWDNYEILAGQEAASEFANKDCNATAAICVNDMVAFGFINGLHMQGYRVPEDISVIGFDDIPFAETFIPALTTVRGASYEVGRLAAMMLIDRMQSSSGLTTMNMNLQPTLVERNTVRNIRK